jgi:MiaB-like tRNA modifying enzyme
MKAFVEGFGCSLNKSDTEQVAGFLESSGFTLVNNPKKASLLILNTCAVKEQTETKMLRRIKELHTIAAKSNAILVVFGCLPKINPNAVKAISKEIVQIGPSLESLASFLELPLQKFSPELEERKASPIVSISPICRGCLGNCSYCSVKNARGSLKSYSIPALNKKFKQALKQGSKEFWLTAQDCGCYGFDLGTNLPELLKELLKNKGEFRIRIGMLNPAHLKEFVPAYLAFFKDPRLFRFFHLPVQSGSNKILGKMNRKYSREDFLEIVKKTRFLYPNASIATDVIVGFPGETEADFRQTISLLKQAKPDVVNISRFGARPNTLALKMAGQLHGRVKKDRSRIVTKLCKEISLKRNKAFVGKEPEILLDEEGKGNSLVGRSQDYKPVVVKEGKLGTLVTVRIEKAFQTYLAGNLLD